MADTRDVVLYDYEGVNLGVFPVKVEVLKMMNGLWRRVANRRTLRTTSIGNVEVQNVNPDIFRVIVETCEILMDERLKHPGRFEIRMRAWFRILDSTVDWRKLILTADALGVDRLMQALKFLFHDEPPREIRRKLGIWSDFDADLAEDSDESDSVDHSPCKKRRCDSDPSDDLVPWRRNPMRPRPQVEGESSLEISESKRSPLVDSVCKLRCHLHKTVQKPVTSLSIIDIAKRTVESLPIGPGKRRITIGYAGKCDVILPRNRSHENCCDRDFRFRLKTNEDGSHSLVLPKNAKMPERQAIYVNHELWRPELLTKKPLEDGDLIVVACLPDEALSAPQDSCVHGSFVLTYKRDPGGYLTHPRERLPNDLTKIIVEKILPELDPRFVVLNFSAVSTTFFDVLREKISFRNIAFKSDWSIGLLEAVMNITNAVDALAWSERIECPNRLERVLPSFLGFANAPVRSLSLAVDSSLPDFDRTIQMFMHEFLQRTKDDLKRLKWVMHSTFTGLIFPLQLKEINVTYLKESQPMSILGFPAKLSEKRAT